ncbi:unnamed protein product [Caenorhabditis nigoni]
MSQPSRLALVLFLILIGDSVANDYDSSPRQSTVTSPPVHISERNYQQQHQQQPSVLTQSYQVLPESRNYYQYPQYLPTHAGYSNIQTVGQPYQMYGSSSGSSSAVSGGNSESYGYSAQSPIPTLAPAPVTGPVTVPERHRTYTPSPTPPSPFSDNRGETQRGRAPGHQAPSSSSQNQGRRFPALPSSSFMIAPKPVLSYGAANPFLANLPPAQGVYGAPVDASHRGYDGSSGAAPAPPPGSSASVDDTWEALEASLDANTRRRHRIF